MNREIRLQRLFAGKDSTLSALFLEGSAPECFVIEDERRVMKVKDETRIPAGRYELKKRKADSPMTLKYRRIYPEFFDYHIQLQDVPKFSYVYIHHGNKESETSGCLLCNAKAVIEPGGEFHGEGSRPEFEVVYKKLSKWLNEGRVFITVTDEVF